MVAHLLLNSQCPSPQHEQKVLGIVTNHEVQTRLHQHSCIYDQGLLESGRILFSEANQKSRIDGAVET
jgi:uncharacterized protein YfeS